MEKPGSLRAAIGQVFPDLARDVDRLRLWVEKGSIRCRQTQSRGFEWTYTLTAVMTDFTGHPSLVFLAVNDWLRVNQPDLLAAGNAETFSFQADILDENTIDLQFDLRLTEQVRLIERDGAAPVRTQSPIPRTRSAVRSAQPAQADLVEGRAAGRMTEASGLEAIEPWLDGLLQRLKPGERRALTSKIGRMLRQRNAERIRDNSDPDGNPMPARKRQLDQRGRIRKRKALMFPKIALARNLKVRTSPEEVKLTFTGRTAQTAAVHHYGLEDKVDRRIPNSIRTRYSARRLLGIPAGDRDAIMDEVLAWLDLKDG